MKRLPVLLFIVAFSTMGFTCAQNVAETPLQKLYALKTDYRSVLTTMVGYRVQCEAKVVELRGDCVGHVKKMQVMDNQIYPVIAQAETAAMAGQSVELATANSLIGAAIAHVSAYILANAIEKGPN